MASPLSGLACDIDSLAPTRPCITIANKFLQVYKMSVLKPFLYWFGFELEQHESANDQSEIYFYQTIIVAFSDMEAKRWGDCLSKEFVEKGNAKKVYSSWIEDVIQFVLTQNSIEHIDWTNVSQDQLENHYQGTASSKKKSDRNLNAFISSTTRNKARDIWNNYLIENHPNHRIETCCKPRITITQTGNYVEW